MSQVATATSLDRHRWVPPSEEDWQAELPAFIRALSGLRLCLLTGAGCSTESGIPDYRGEGTARRARNPIQYRQFLENDWGRRRYWARSMMGWPHFRSATPNSAHLASAALERAGRLSGTITQNVDRLHHQAGSRNVVELHGALAEVRCLSCGALEHRDDLQHRLTELNPWLTTSAFELNPDGDTELPDLFVDSFRVADCVSCGGLLKPNVVFFGEGVPKDTVDRAWKVFDTAQALLVVGSSLTVFSGYRFVRKAMERSLPIFVVNIGPTRADPHAHHKLRGPAGAVLSELGRHLGCPPTE